ncbi:hypothetical protein BN1723_012812 [Verticillium longisporum]|uniref:ATP synthase subunit d, mitochondrial n=1 Tax=Verticillium longisporum TaxID=100787 RepID=A0A0G4LMJ4_VERLO|nr:hypothetical protein BN1723_012812 [Verticillium longisporum]
MAARSAALKLDWVKVTSSLNLRGQTVASLQAFKKRNEDARRKVQQLSELPTAVDFAHYRSVLKNQAVVDEIEKRFTAHKPAAYDVSRQLKAIEAFEVEAVKNAEATKEKVGLELKDLEKTLSNIETARPFEDITVDDFNKAVPEVEKKTAELVAKGRWSVPGYKVRFESTWPLFLDIVNAPFRRSSAISLCCKRCDCYPIPFVYCSMAQAPHILSMDHFSRLVLSSPPPLDAAWLQYEDDANLKAPKKVYASPVERQPVYAEECRQLHAKLMAQGAPFHRLSEDITTTHITTPSSLDNYEIPILQFKHTRVADPKVVVIYYHGGGLYVGEADSEELSCRRIVKDVENSTVYSVGYRLMPKHPASTCISDGVDAIRAIIKLVPSDVKLVVVGSSSGGVLATSVQQLVLERPFTGTVLRCPVTSDGGSNIEHVPERLRPAYTSATECFANVLLGVFRREEVRDGLERMPLEASVHELRGLGRTWVQVCANDTLYSDGVCYAIALKEAGVEVEVDVVEGWPHTFWLKAPALPRAVEAEEAMVKGLKWVLQRG